MRPFYHVRRKFSLADMGHNVSVRLKITEQFRLILFKSVSLDKLSIAKCLGKHFTIYTPIQIWKIKNVTPSLEYSHQVKSSEKLAQ